MRTRSRSTSTTPGTALIAAVAFSAAPSGARSSRVSTVERASRKPSSAIMTATAIAAAASPQAIAEADSARPMMTAIEPSTSEAKCSASAASAWLLVSRAARCSARARQKFTAISTSSTTNGIAEIVGGGAPSRKAAVGFDQDAAGQHIKQRDDAERRQALELAVAVMMFLVRGAVGNPHHQPGDDGRDHVDRGVQRLGDQRETADGDADHEFGRGHAGAGENRDRGDCGFFAGSMGCHARRFSSPSVNIKRRSQAQSPLICRKRFVANCSEFKQLKLPLGKRAVDGDSRSNPSHIHFMRAKRASKDSGPAGGRRAIETRKSSLRSSR